MRSSDFLFHLIKSLTKGERRNFKLFARLQEGDKKYIQLFDAINKQKSYDERSLLEQFKGERFTKQFSVPKNYLYNYLLKTLIIFQKDQQSDLGNLLNQVRVLLSKNLYQQAHKLVRKAKLMAERQERFPELLELLKHERIIFRQTAKQKEFRAFIALIQQKELEAIGQFQQLLTYEHLYDEIQMVLGKSANSRSHSDLNAFSHILKNDLVTDPTKASSTRARIRRLDILMNINRYSGNLSKSLEYSEETIAIYDQNPTIKRDDNLRYIISLSNLAILYYHQKKDPETSAELLQKLKNTEVYTPQEQLRVFEKYYHFSLALAIGTGNKELGQRAISELEDNFKLIEGKIRKTQELGIYYSSAYFYLQIGLPEKALFWVNKVLNEPKTELRTDLQTMARILNLVIHYELQNFDVIEYSIKSATRFLSKKDRLYAYERSILRLVRKMTSTYGTYEHRTVMKDAYEEVEQILENPFERKAKGLFDVLAWLDSKLQNIPMSQVISEAAQFVQK